MVVGMGAGWLSHGCLGQHPPSHQLISGWRPKGKVGQCSSVCVRKGKDLQNIMTSHEKKVLQNAVANITDGEGLART